MGTLWIVVAHRADARIFRRERNNQLQLVHQIQNPDGRLKDQEIDSERPGRNFSSAAPQRHGFSPHVSSSEQIMIDFSKEVAQFLEDSRNRNLYNSLILVAGPQFLGHLRQDLTNEANGCIVQTIDKNLGGFSDHEVSTYLQQAIQEERKRSSNLESA